MRKRDELTNPNSCMNKAHDEELTFVLLGRDACAPIAIRMWCEARVLSGKNRWADHQILEALAVADEMQRTEPADGPPIADPPGESFTQPIGVVVNGVAELVAELERHRRTIRECRMALGLSPEDDCQDMRLVEADLIQRIADLSALK